jgi:hypothetical protein
MVSGQWSENLGVADWPLTTDRLFPLDTFFTSHLVDPTLFCYRAPCIQPPAPLRLLPIKLTNRVSTINSLPAK